MGSTTRPRLLVASLVIAVAFCAGRADSQGTTGILTVPGMPPVVDPRNLYSETRSNSLSPAVANAPARVYVPHLQSNDVRSEERRVGKECLSRRSTTQYIN